ncbi:hypothetical protein E2C01_049444 [Portunus trituberculatus]|uniref:Uncharacterized protein n=1 Tax=Portunus trituberculatus TaxID=210409 RepID=A0A5B7GD62_PORTR|nr:hypothetical protein [Portunus trituberculatus]
MFQKRTNRRCEKSPPTEPPSLSQLGLRSTPVNRVIIHNRVTKDLTHSTPTQPTGTITTSSACKLTKDCDGLMHGEPTHGLD